MSATEQDYYEYLTRTDHPVFQKVFTTSVDSTTPLNSIINRVIARQLVKLKAQIDDLRANAFPNTATLTLIANWEETYFGYTKPSLDLSARIDQLLAKINSKDSMDVATVIALSQAITGQTPRIQRTITEGAWTIGVSAIGLDTVVAGLDSVADPQTYLVIFDSIVDSTSLRALDNKLTEVQKGGSVHFILARPPQWVIGQSAIGVDTIPGG